MRGLNVSVLRSALGDCTNGGVTARHDRLTLYADGMEGFIEPGDYGDDYPMLLVKRDKEYLGGYRYAVPAVFKDGRIVEAPVPAGHVGWMAGGNYVGTSDSRFRRAVTVLGAIPVHDRSEG